MAVWVTNKRSIAHFVRETLFPHWEIEYIAEWLWIKVCRTFDILLIFLVTQIVKKQHMCANGFGFTCRFITVRPRFKATLFLFVSHSIASLANVSYVATCKLARSSS